MRSGDPVAVGQGGHHVVEGDAAPQRGGRGRQRVRDLLDPVQREPHVARAPRRRQPEARPQLLVERDALGAHLGARPPPRNPSTGHGLNAAMRATRGSSKFKTATPEGGSAATSSLLARATPSRSPKYSTCAMATLVTIPTSGRATSARRAMWPRRGRPSRARPTATSSGALSNVSGRPSSLLNDRSLAADPKVDDEAAGGGCPWSSSCRPTL